MNLEQNYNRDEFITFLKSFIPKFTKDIRKVDASALQVAKEVFYLGESVELQLSIFEITHTSSVDARVALAMDGFRVMKSSAAYRALIIYRFDKGEDWRLSLMTAAPGVEKNGKIIQSFSNPRRFSFFLGPNAKVNTPYQFLIKQGAVKDFAELQKRFSIEVVNKEFYTQIAVLFTQLAGGKRQIGRKSIDAGEGDLRLPSTNDDVLRKEFTVRLIGRLVFCWFLKKKKSDKGFTLLSEDLLSSKAVRENKNYYHYILEPLFFEVLNTPVEKRDKKYVSEPWNQTPFLNGGLFTPHNRDYYDTNVLGISKYINVLKVPDSWLKELFEIFEVYNFTIDENTSVDVELSIDPEMLGRIFENLLAEINPETGETARKSTGSYYTPRPIVEYMVDESLKQYLLTKTGIAEEKISMLFTYNDSDMGLSAKEEALVVEALDVIKIIDPACGSGAFPMGILQKMLFILQKIDPDSQNWLDRKLVSISDAALRKDLKAKLKADNFNYIHKLGIIRDSIYGVDIQPIAVEISKLRFFLSLIVDEQVNDNKGNRGIEPLPNLEFKFVCADSLIGLPQKKHQDSFTEATEDIITLKELRDDYLRSYGPEKKRVEKKFLEVQNKMAKHALSWALWGSEKSQTMKLSQWDPFSEEPCGWFDPEWMFGVEEGFDVVIGNPPYVSITKFARTELQTVWKQSFKKTFAAQGDIYCLFYEKGLSLLRDRGTLTFISSNKFQRAGYGEGLRQLLASQQIHALIDFCELPVFAAGTDPMIVIVSKVEVTMDHEFCVLVVKDEIEFDSISQSVESRASRYMPEQLKVEGWSLEGANGLSLVEKLRSKGIPMGNYVNGRFFRGILTGLNEAFVIDRITRDRLIREDQKSVELIMPWIRGKDIKRWTNDFQDIYVIFTRRGVEIDKYKAIKQHLTQYRDKLEPRPDSWAKGVNWPGRKPGNYKWYEIQDDTAYYAAFAESKIVFNETSKCLHAYFDSEGNAINKTGFIVLSSDALFVLAVLNSTAMDWLYRSTFPSWGDPWNSGRIQFRGNLMAQIPIPTASISDKSRLTKLAEQAAKLADAGDEIAVRKVDHEINEIVYRLFELTNKEVSYIEKSLANTHKDSSNSNEDGSDDE